MEAKITQIGKYQVTGILGKGAMGVVYQGFDPIIQRYVAIKTIDAAQVDDANREIYQRFQREARAAGNLSHTNIVSIYEFGEDEGLAYIVMEHIEGRNLADRMKEDSSLGVSESTTIIKGILSALSHAHAMGVVHRDIKPSNIIIARNGIVKVADFGIARVGASELTQAGTIIGTPGYMAPEQLKGESVDTRADLFSAGVIFYEMLTGQKAFPGSTMASVIYNVINKELPPPSELHQAVPAGLDAVVSRAVAKSTADRFETADQFSEAIDTALQRRAAASTLPEPAAAAAPGDQPDRPTVRVQAPARRSGRRLWVGLGALVVLAGLGGYLLMRPGAPPGQQKIAAQQFRPGNIFQDCDTCPSMTVVPAGQFVQGSSPAEENPTSREEPVHLVSIDRPFAVGRYEITRRQFSLFVAETGYKADGCDVYDGRWNRRADRNWQTPGFDQQDNDPVTCVSWNDTQAYGQWLSSKTGHAYRLLSASEWEYAARDGGLTSGRFNADPDSICRQANVADRTAAKQYLGWQAFDCQDDFVHTAPVGSFRPNKLGIYDLAGNVFEWVADCWNENYQDAPTNGVAWAAGDCTRHVLRGGSWFSRPEFLRATFRNSFPADYRSSSFGFRVARDLP